MSIEEIAGPNAKTSCQAPFHPNHGKHTEGEVCISDKIMGKMDLIRLILFIFFPFEECV